MPARISSTAPAGARYSPRGVFGCRQRARVEFAVRCQRQRLDRHHRRRHHVARQPLSQLRADHSRIRAPSHIAHQALIARTILTGDHHRLPDPVHPTQRRLHLTQLDAIAADLDLLISTPGIAQLPVGAPTHQIPGAIHALPGRPERTRHKPRPGQPRPAHIPHTHTTTGHIQLTDHPDRHRAQPPIEHEQRRPRHGRPDRRRTRPRTEGQADRDVHRGLGRAVGVDHHPPRRPPVHQLSRACLAAHHQRRRPQTVR